MKGLQQKRKEKGLTQVALGRELGLSLRTIYMYESGQRFPSKKSWNKLCKFFDCKIDDLL